MVYLSIVVIGLVLVGGSNGHRLIRRQDDEATLFFDIVPDQLTCQPSLISWDYFGRQAPMTLIVSNIGVSSSSTTASPGPVNKTLATSYPPQSGAFEWQMVDVPPGNYRLNASLPTLDLVFQSGVFQVLGGSDTSCLAGPSSTSSDSPASSTPPASSQTFPVSEPSSSGSSIPSDIPVPTAVPSSGRSNTGTIVGVVLGVVALGIVVLGFYFFIRRKRTSKSGHGRGKQGRWNGLGSTDSRTVLANTGMSAGGTLGDHQTSSGQRRNHFHGDSMASMQITDESFSGAAGEKYTASRKGSVGTTFEDHEGMVLTTLPTLHQHPNGRESGRRPSYPDIVHSEERPRRNSRSQQSTPFPDANISRSSSTAGASVPYSTTAGDANSLTPPSTVAEAHKANRNSIGAGNGRKRKPVPAYNPKEISGSATSSPSSSTPFSSSPAVSNALDHETPYSQPHGGASLQTPASQAVGHYTTRNLTSRPETAEGGDTLAHKSSFGPTGVVEGKQLHYLMPDLPPEARSTRR